MKNQIYILIYFVFSVLFCCPFMATSQGNVVATYDEATKVLTLDNQLDAIELRKSEDMPISMQKYIEDNGSPCYISFGSTIPFENVSREEMDAYKEITFYGQESGFTVAEKITIKIIEQKKEDLADQQGGAQENAGHSRKYLPYIIAGILLLMMVMAKLFYSRRKRKKLDEERKASSQVMQVMEEEKNDCSVGLNHVYQDSDNYYMLDMHVFFKDTAVEKVYMSREIIKKINSYFKAYLDNPERTPETGCYLIGVWEKITGSDDSYNVSIEEMVTPGDDMVPGEFSLNFGLKIGIDLGSTIRNLCEKTQRDYVQTAWMHSHPGLGLFLSSHDLVVQQQLTYPDEPKRLLAIVIDTNTPDWKTVFFSAKSDGTMNNKEDLLQVISYDTLLEWSRHKTISASSFATVIKNAFNITSEDSADQFAFTSKAVNQMDDVIDTVSSGVAYGFHSEIQQVEGRKIRLVSECETMDSSWDNCFIIKLPDDSWKLDATHCAELLKSHDFGLVYVEGQQSYLVYRNAQQEISTLPVPLKEMKEWTRRKRV